MAIEKENLEIIDALLCSKNIDVNIKLVFIIEFSFLYSFKKQLF